LPVGLPIIAGANDGGLANLGSGAYLPGQSVITVGTSGAVRHLLDRPVLDRFERTWCYLLDEGCWFRGGAINNGGLALQWVRQRFYSELPEAEGYERMWIEAASVDAGAAGLLALPYFVGERSPHWNATARAALVGLGLEHTRAHIARAVMEGVAFCLADVWEALAESSPLGVPSRLTGGITRSQLWRQIVADVLGVRLACLEAADASAVGAAMLGLQALGVVDAYSLASRMEPGVIIEPDPERHIFYEKRHTAFQALYQRALSPSTFIH
jgi:gluconokinase